MDIAVTHAGAPGLTLWRNVEGPNTSAGGLNESNCRLHGALRGWGVTPIDIDNDGWIDLAAIVETKAGPRVRVFRNRGDGSFEDVSHALGLDSVKLHPPRGLIAAEVDGDGAADLIVTQVNAPPVLLRNVGANKNHFVRLDLTGFADNKTALGVKVEVFANGLWQKWELAGASGYQTQAAPQILVGLGEAEGIDLLRILWPTGVLQDEIDLPHQPVIAMKEADRRGSSCPVLFAWDGHKYKLVTDVIGAAVVGHWFTPTRRNTPNPGEWIKVDGAQMCAGQRQGEPALHGADGRGELHRPVAPGCGGSSRRMSRSIPTSASSTIRRLLRAAWWPRPVRICPWARGTVKAATCWSRSAGAITICQRIHAAALRRLRQSARA